METYDEFLAAVNGMADEPDFPKLREMLKVISRILDTLAASFRGKEYDRNYDLTATEDLLCSFFGSCDYEEMKEKTELLVAKLNDIVEKQSGDPLFSDLPNRKN